MEIKVKFAKMRDGAIIPSKRDEDAGFDIYPCLEQESLKIRPHETCMIPTGICSAFDKEYFIKLLERGSTGKLGIGQRAGVIDSGYRGEWFIPITNHNDKSIIITRVIDHIPMLDDTIVYSAHKAICQAVFLPVPKVNVQEVTYEEIMEIKSTRGTGALGSSGK